MQKPFVLIAEDDKDDRFLLQTSFEESDVNCQMEFFDNGDQLMAYLTDLITRNILDIHYPTFIMLDLNMPGKNGYEVLKEIKQHPRLKIIPVIVFSTTTDADSVNTCYGLGANSYIVKPSEFRALVKQVAGLLRYWTVTASLPTWARSHS